MAKHHRTVAMLGLTYCQSVCHAPPCFAVNNSQNSDITNAERSGKHS